MIRVLVVDDQPLVRAGIRAVLERAEDVEVVGEAGDGRAALDRLRVCRDVDVVLMDLRMPVLDGIEATRRIVADAALEAVTVVALTTFDDEELVLGALRAGASGFLLKDAEPDELRRGVRAAAAGEAMLSPAVTRGVVRAAVTALAPQPAAPEALQQLTARELEVLAAVGEGMSNEEIARALVMSPATARTHVGRVLSKLGARDRAQLAALAWRTGLLPRP
ncbi:response regulator [Modestobacter versicolor]|uniref:DNA-binding NarL/FixJ family response regulator n=1 Tax=Modestobacter versicolor TaxID=429133 RepID=A0A323V671_9ACTN|nr:response regulator transcription factor [Modestobacter versicolor]MBB3676324.1 DNA-binding NarL/FixJ family response regulator [Modestobacter versicolor]PZA20124.1 DNA-binding response regulator [Modestobacter versicolor]